MKKIVTLIDAGTGNLRSVHKALEHLGALVTLTSDPAVIVKSHRLILPGVGAFGDFMKGLRLHALDEAIIEVARRGDPLMGICVGMQALFEIGEELGEHQGLGLLPGRVIRFPDFPGLKIPHTGWNQIQIQADSILWKDIDTGDYAYFNHSYYCHADHAQDIIALSDYGLPFACSVQRDHLVGVQFHPEKSQNVGLQVLANFLASS